MDIAPLISVIVPIYNVEKYVRKCLESLKSQTLREIEVICIDDGSTDGSGKIADEFESEDFPIFRVIHTENRGLSAARNRGLDEARADRIMFVDSDDWVDSRFCEIPFKTAVRNNADLVCFKAYRVTKQGKVKKPKKTNALTGIVDEMTAHEHAGIAAWNKLYKHNLFSEVRFPEGHVHEELATAHRFVNEAEKIVVLHDYLYYYTNRKGSISNTHTANNMRDAFVAALDRYEFLTEQGYPSRKIASLPQQYAIGFLASTRSSKDVMYVRAAEIVDSIRGIPKEFKIKQKIAIITWKINKSLFYLVCWISGKRIE